MISAFLPRALPLFLVGFISVFAESLGHASLCGVRAAPALLEVERCKTLPRRDEKARCLAAVYLEQAQAMGGRPLWQQSEYLNQQLILMRRERSHDESEALVTLSESTQLYIDAEACAAGRSSACAGDPVRQQVARDALPAARELQTGNFLLISIGNELHALRAEGAPGFRDLGFKGVPRQEELPAALNTCQSSTGESGGGSVTGGWLPHVSQGQQKTLDIECPSWLGDQFCLPRSGVFAIPPGPLTPPVADSLMTTAAPLLYQELAAHAVGIQARLFAGNLAFLHPDIFSDPRKMAAIRTPILDAAQCLTGSAQEVHQSILDAFPQTSSGSSGANRSAVEDARDVYAQDVVLAVRNMSVLQPELARLRAKSAALESAHQHRCFYSTGAPLAEYSEKYFVEATPECRESALAIRKFDEEILAPLEARVDLIRSTHPELHLPIGGKDYTDGICVSGHMQAVVEGAATFPGIAGVRAGLGGYRKKQEDAHYDPRCGTPLWKLMSREIQVPNPFVSDSSEGLRKWAQGKLPDFIDQSAVPLAPQVDSEISAEKQISVALEQYLDRLQKPASPSELKKALDWHDLAAPIQLEVVVGSIQQACQDPQDYGKRLLLNDPVGRDFFASRPESKGMQWLYCHARRTYSREVDLYNKSIDSLSLTLGLIGFSHPAVALSVLPIEFGIEYTQWREADFQKRMDLSLAVAGAGDYRLADRAMETLGSGEITLYLGVAAMAAGGVGDAVTVADELVAAGARAGNSAFSRVLSSGTGLVDRAFDSARALKLSAQSSAVMARFQEQVAGAYRMIPDPADLHVYLESAWSKFKNSREFLALPAAEVRKISTWMQDSLVIARDEVASLMRLRLGRDSLQSESGRSIVSILSKLSDQEVLRVYARTRGLDAGEALTDLEQAIASRMGSFERRLDGPIRTANTAVNSARRLEVLNPMLSAAPPKMADALRIAEEAMREGASMRAWAEDLYAECLEVAMKSSDPSILEGILESRSIPESIYSEVLRQRGIRNGFSPNGVTLDRQVDQEEFMSYMRDRRLIVDETFRRDKHGVFAHIAQMDYLQYALTQRGSPVKAVEVYVYLGSNKAIHEAGWERLFDGFAGDVYEPETFYPILEELFPRTPSTTGWSK